MDMVDMKYTKAEAKEEAAEYSGKPKPPEYPWGLCIRLEKDELDKLNLASLPQVGDEYHIIAVGKVTSVSSSMRDQRDEEKTVSIQITMLQMDGEAQDDGAEAPKKQAKGKSGPAGTIMSKY